MSDKPEMIAVRLPLHLARDLAKLESSISSLCDLQSRVADAVYRHDNGLDEQNPNPYVTYIKCSDCGGYVDR
jgi:hypothetical protein